MIVVPAEAAGAADRAAAVLAEGGVVAFPTDTVYGVAAALDRPTALERLYAIKGRPSGKPLPVLLGERADLGRVARPVAAPVEALLDRFWPGALTLVTPGREGLPGAVLGDDQTVGVRVPDQATARAIVAAAGGVLATTSANRSGSPPATTAAEVVAQLGAGVDLLIDGGRSGGGVASTVAAVSAAGVVVLRAGGITAEALEAAWRGIVGGEG